MTVISVKKRKKLKDKVFGLPEDRKYPMPDKVHAANAKARATQMVEAGKLTFSEKSKIDRKANKILKGSSPSKKASSIRKTVSKRKSSY